MLTITVKGPPGSDAHEREMLAHALITEIRPLPAVSVERVRDGAVPVGAKSMLAEMTNQFVVAVTASSVTSAVPLIVGTVRDWLGRQREGCTIAIKDGDFELTMKGDDAPGLSEAISGYLKRRQAGGAA